MPQATADPSRDEQNLRAADESTPLLNAPETAGIASCEQEDVDSTTVNGHNKQNGSRATELPDETGKDDDEDRMPYAQIVLLCWAALADPIAYFAIFPFINEMIHLKGNVEETNVGFWSGMIECLFSVVQMCLMIFYGRAADRLGRKPVLVFSLTGIAFATALFGMAQNLWQMVLFRCIAGCFAGSVVTVRAMISENCTKTTQARAFSWYMFVRNAGIFLGPLIGGGLANPAEQFPSVFKGVTFWEDYPYALATWFTGAVVLSSAVTTLIFVKETLKRGADGTSDTGSKVSTWEILKSPGVAMVLYIQAHVSLLALAYTAILTVFMFTSVAKGGFGFNDQWIAIFMALGGGSQALWMLLAFPYLQRRFGTGTVMRWCAAGYGVLFVGFPVLNEVLRAGMVRTFWIAAPPSFVIGSGVAMLFTCVQLSINDVSPSPAGFATVNAIALAISSGVRAFAPIVGTSIFAVGIKGQFMRGHLVFAVFFILMVALVVACNKLPKNAEGRPEPSSRPDS